MIVPIQWVIALLLISTMQREPAAQIRMISGDERKALETLYEKTGGNTWVRRDGWLGPIGTECGWYGVVCARESSRQIPTTYTVTDLQLSDNGLKGQIPPEVTALKNLKSLVILGNAVKGPFPDDLLQKYDRGQLYIVPSSLIHDVEEIVVDVNNPSVLCGAFRVWMSADGNVRRERKLCREKDGRQTREVYYEYQRGKTHDFDRLARFLISSGFFETKSTVPNGYWFDVTETSVTAKRSGGITMTHSWSPAEAKLDWELEMISYGLIARVQWSGPPTTKK
ncbi:MAG: hypothetical protein LAP85_26600 [Acidobacteriia bacterium]|nr:hypothetical protein [Terriglobia bacterium]